MARHTMYCNEDTDNVELFIRLTHVNENGLVDFKILQKMLTEFHFYKLFRKSISCKGIRQISRASLSSEGDILFKIDFKDAESKKYFLGNKCITYKGTEYYINVVEDDKLSITFHFE